MIIYGKNAVKESLQSDTTFNKLFVQKGAHDKIGQEIIDLAKSKKIKIYFEQDTFLSRKSGTPKHQGFVAEITEFKYCTVEEILQTASEKGEPPFILILDSILDPHNLGAIIRSAECCGVHGIIIQKDRSCPVNQTIYKTSAGAVGNMKIAKVVNLSREIEFLKKKGVWVNALEYGGDDIFTSDLTGSIAIVVGSEGDGVRPLVKSSCDRILSIPLRGQINSLNASVATGVAIYETLRQRLKK
jgi:23S rRNA (guanosine2251-2'-O)-methyltransferase